jgi:hypothetical protein
LRLKGLASQTAIAETDGSSWKLDRRGFWPRIVQATDANRAVVGEFAPRGFRRGGTLRWAGRELTLRPACSWRERYALADGERELAIFDGKSWGKRPVKISVEEPQAIEPGLLLFAAFVVRGLARAADASVSASTTTASTSG